ncbi:MAG: class I SAM-dependent methyltransferase [Flavobacteriales bacterium]|nr:class I SAM-dependent methyltransferase [Flavobacteriales bacterium]
MEKVPDRPASDAARFFDRTSGNYREKYTRSSPFHHYYFNERLDKATRGLELSDKNVLDIGSGTGNLYDHLLPRFPGVRFFATDVSAGMLSQSLVPEADRFVGSAYDHQFAQRTFDAVFMLGVTTYMDAAELERNLAFIARSLNLGGQAIITFTHSGGLDTWMRWLLKLPLRLFGSRDKVLSSGVRTRTYGVDEANKALASHLKIDRLEFHNHTVFPFGLLLPGLSIALAHRIDRLSTTNPLHRLLSSDIIVRCSAKRLL